MSPARLHLLLTLYHAGTISTAELHELRAMLQPDQLSTCYDEDVDNVFRKEAIIMSESTDARIWAGLSLQQTAGHIRSMHRIHFLRTAWFRVAVAVLVVMSGVLAYYRFADDSKNGKGMVVAPVLQPEIMPGNNKAVLVLSDGRKVELNDDASDMINDGSLAIRNDNGLLNYEGATHPTAGAGSDYAQDTRSRRHPSEGGDWRASYNTMSTPRGGQYKLVLPDGSKVWLNAESSITFPTLFAGKTREIKMTGEAYFEIKADKDKPFIVKTISDEIQVLGTSFNINAYDDAPVKTSLLEGSVKIDTKILKPGQAYQQNKIISTNLGQDIAWKNGEFNFEDKTAEQVMGEIGRWYDLEIVYENKAPDILFFGSVSRNVPLSTVLKGLEKSGVRFITEGKKLIVR